MRKRISSQPQRESPSANTAWLDLEALALVEVTSEDAAHPIESALLPVSATGWRAESPRGTDDPPPLRSAAEAEAHPPAVSRREGGAHAGVRPALVANGRRFIARYRAPAVSLQPIGSHGGVRGISSRVGRGRFGTHDHSESEWRLIRLTDAIALGMTKDRATLDGATAAFLR